MSDTPPKSRGSPRLCHERRRGEPQAPEHRLDRSSLHARTGSVDADGRDVSRHRGSEEKRQGPPFRRVEFLRDEIDGRRRGRREDSASRISSPARTNYSLILPRHRDDLCRRWPSSTFRLDPLFSSGRRRSDRQIPQGQAVARGRLNTGSGVSQPFLGGATFDTVEKLAVFAESRGHTLLELAMSWLARRARWSLRSSPARRGPSSSTPTSRRSAGS